MKNENVDLDTGNKSPVLAPGIYVWQNRNNVNEMTLVRPSDLSNPKSSEIIKKEKDQTSG